MTEVNMIFGHGIDIVEIHRIKNAIEKSDRFMAKVFTDREIAYCENKNKALYSSFAVRFSAKEAFLKALGTGWGSGISLREVEVVCDEAGKPDIVLHGEALSIFSTLGLSKIFLSLSHSDTIATASVILER
jgi:holo-[acyl-carrier protein] synthase